MDEAAKYYTGERAQHNIITLDQPGATNRFCPLIQYNGFSEKKTADAFKTPAVFFFSVQDETRTHTAYRPLPPQSSASTNSATWTFVESWSEKRDSNPRPRPWQGRALPTELFSRIKILRMNLS